MAAIYLDNNATTFMTKETIAEMVDWCNRGNPSAGYNSALVMQNGMESFRKYLTQGLPGYKVIFTSGGSEGNCFAITAVVSAYVDTIGGVPHVVCSAIEHKSILDLLGSLVDRGVVTCTYVQPISTGHIQPKAVEGAIRAETCLIVVMHANNETGAINNIRDIAKLARSRNIPLHSDSVQSFGKINVGPWADSISVSFHKLHAPPGVGALIIREKLIKGYDLKPMIFGSQNYSLRGGTENIHGIMASCAAVKKAMKDRDKHNEIVGGLKKFAMDAIAKCMPTRTYTDYLSDRSPRKPAAEIVFLSGINYYLPNTLLLSVVCRCKTVCNTELRKQLEHRGIIISVGSACNTSAAKASHILYAMGADELIRRGALRVSLSDYTKPDEMRKFVKEFITVVKDHLGEDIGKKIKPV